MTLHRGKRQAFLFTAAAVMMLVSLSGTSHALSIVGSKHDFSTYNSGTTPFANVWETPGPVFPLVIDEVCVFCHTPHGASKNVPGLPNAPLWNRTNSPYNPPTSYNYTMYSSATFSGAATISTAPTGISMMCMSCHDGVTSIAVNTLLNAPGSGNPTITANGIDAPGAMGNVYNYYSFFGFGPNIGDNWPGSGWANTIDLSNDHPVSFNWPSGMTGTKLYDPTSIDSRLRLFGGASNNRIECATCHQVHDPVYPPFLSMPNDNSNMCRSCHIK